MEVGVVAFINPYTFVRQPLAVSRGRPAWHGRLKGDRLCGRLQVTMRARTPLLIRGIGTVPADRLSQLERESGAVEVADIPRRADGSAIVPGSSVMGAVRSVHEVLAGGCLRILDEDYAPIHRHPASSAETRPVQLGIVAAVDGTGRATEVAVAGEIAWVPLRMLQDLKDLPRAGDRLMITNPRVATVNARRELAAGQVKPHSGLSGATDDGSWVLLVTDTAARDPDNKLFFVAGRMATTTTYPVSAAAWELFGRCVRTTDDLREYRRTHHRRDPVYAADIEPEYVPVQWPPPRAPQGAGPVVGYRLAVRPFFRQGQPVWVRVADGDVAELRLSQLWRFEGLRSNGTGRLGERVGEAGPCEDPASLCPSCQVFGSVDPRGDDEDDPARQRGYRGHVRIDDARLEPGASAAGASWHLAPLSAPRPSAGQFYLDNTGKGEAARYRRPTALWASDADTGGLRPIRGRKFYWRTRAPDRPVPPREGAWPRGWAREHQSAELTPWVRLIPAKTGFTTSVTFENLTRAQVGGLLAALDPRLILQPVGDGEIVTSVGGGKPFGFGAVTVDVRVEWLQTAASRYLDGQDVPVSVDDLVAEFRTGVDPATAEELAAALTIGRVADDLVWYPPGVGLRGQKSFDQGFEKFWQRSTGITMAGEVRPLVTLPPPQGDPVMQSPPRPGGRRG
jgi:CRISPR-associated protein (TIGR03986 family)